MLIALLAVLGVDLVVVVAFVLLMLGRRRWVKRQPGAFRGAIRVVDGEIDGLDRKWHRGYGRWVRDILVWTKAPFHLRNELVPTDGVVEQRPARAGELKRLGDRPTVIRFDAGDAAVEVAASTDGDASPAGPYQPPGGRRSVRDATAA